MEKKGRGNEKERGARDGKRKMEREQENERDTNKATKKNSSSCSFLSSQSGLFRTLPPGVVTQFRISASHFSERQQRSAPRFFGSKKFASETEHKKAHLMRGSKKCLKSSL